MSMLSISLLIAAAVFLYLYFRGGYWRWWSLGVAIVLAIDAILLNWG
jgi:hypothetical protein